MAVISKHIPVNAGVAKAWCLYDQVSVGIDDSYNVSSVTDSSTGKFVVNYSSAFSARGAVNYTVNRRGYSNIDTADSIATGSASLTSDDNATNPIDRNENAVVSHGDLA